MNVALVRLLAREKRKEVAADTGVAKFSYSSVSIVFCFFYKLYYIVWCWFFKFLTRDVPTEMRI